MVILNEFSSIKEWGNLFLYKKQGEVSLGHFKSLQSNINHINIFFGNRAISSIRALEIDDFLKSPRLVSFITGRQLSKKTLTSIRNTFIIQHVGVKFLAKHRRPKGGLCTIMKLI